MNYEPNTREWKRGDFVIHDADAKEARMLMRVVGPVQGGMVRTEYVEQTDERLKRWGKGERSRLINDPKYLHDPARFGISLPLP